MGGGDHGVDGGDESEDCQKGDDFHDILNYKNKS